MNVIIANKYKDALSSLDIEVIKKLEGEFSVEEIIETFKNFFFQKMILDITALKDYKSIKTLQQLSLSLDMDRLILLLDGSPETSKPEYLSDLISMHIYNFTLNVDGVKWLYDHPNSYRDVAQYHQLDTNHNVAYVSAPTVSAPKASADSSAPAASSAPKYSYYEPDVKQNTIICLKNITDGAGATTLAYIMKRQLSKNYKVVAIEVDRHDFRYFDDNDMYSVSNSELGNMISKYSGYDAVIIDANNSPAAESFANETFYLLEPSKIKINKALSKNPKVFINAKDKKVILNKCMLSKQDVSDFEYETKLSVFQKLPPLNDQSDENVELNNFLKTLGFVKQVGK